jgi:hypothetical protein
MEDCRPSRAWLRGCLKQISKVEWYPLLIAAIAIASLLFVSIITFTIPRITLVNIDTLLAEPAELDLLFPSKDFADFDNASRLCGEIALNLGVPSISPFTDNSHNLSDYSMGDDLNCSFPVSLLHFDCYHWWARGSDGLEIGALFNQHDRLVQLRIFPAESNSPLWEAYSMDEEDLASASVTIALALGLPSGLVSDTEVVSQGTFTSLVTGSTTVIHEVTARSNLGNLEVHGANEVKLLFKNRKAYRVDAFCFYECPEPKLISESTAMQVAIDYSQEQLYDRFGNLSVSSGPSVKGLVFDQENLTIAYLISFGFYAETYWWFLWQGSARITVDAQTGDPISMLSGIVHVDRRFIDDSNGSVGLLQLSVAVAATSSTVVFLAYVILKRKKDFKKSA